MPSSFTLVLHFDDVYRKSSYFEEDQRIAATIYLHTAFSLLKRRAAQTGEIETKQVNTPP
jgi:hypothetical protein